MMFDIGAQLAGSIAGNVVGIVFKPLNAAVDAAQVASSYRIEMNHWWQLPGIPPTPLMVMDLFNKGFIDETTMNQACRNQGVNLYYVSNDTRENNHRLIWRKQLDSMLLRPTTEFIMGQWGRGYWDRDSIHARTALKLAGADVEAWEQYVTAFYETPPMDALMAGRLRNLITVEQFKAGMERHGYGNTHHRDMYRGLLQANPPPTDWIHFAVKESLSPEVANAVRLYDEFPQAITQYMGWHGLNWKVGFDITADGVDRPATVMDLYWGSHWTTISPTQAYEMFHKFRPDRIARYQAQGFNIQPFAIDDVRRWLRINDYPPSVRDQLAALSYTPLRLVDIRQAIQMNWREANDAEFSRALTDQMRANVRSYDRQWAISQFRDRGVHPDDAATQVDLVIASYVWNLNAPVRNAKRALVNKVIRSTMAGYDVGIVPTDNVGQNLRALGFDQATIDAFIALSNAKEAIDTAKAAIAATRRGYLSGALDSQRVRRVLADAGINEGTREALLTRWNMEWSNNRIQATTAKILAWTGQGMMTPAQARRRLENLGWLDPDTTMLISEARNRNLQLRGQAIRAAETAASKRAAALEKVRRDALRNTEKLEQAIRRQTPITTLQRMLRKGLINSQTFIQRAVRAGYSEGVARKYLEDALVPEPPKPTLPKPEGGVSDPTSIVPSNGAKDNGNATENQGTAGQPGDTATGTGGQVDGTTPTVSR